MKPHSNLFLSEIKLNISNVCSVTEILY